MRIKLLFFAAALAALVPFSALAATTTAKSPFYYGVWLPFWQTQPGQEDIAVHLDSLHEISPFSYEVGSGGTIIDDLGINNGGWDTWLSAVHDMGIKVIPTIAWFDGNGIYNLLSSAKKRQAEENAITALAKAQNFNGIDIDFESMLSQTRPYYSLFIQGLAGRLHPLGKTVTCTVAPRTPLSLLYNDPPASITYAENYTVLNQYCDEVRVMAYDQELYIEGMNSVKGNGNLYAPVADPAWVEAVIKETLKYVSPKKVVLGVPTYGYEYEVSWANGTTTYQRVRSFSYLQAMDRADMLGIEPQRNSAGELSFLFASSTYIQEPASLTSIVESTLPLALASPQQIAGKSDPAANTIFFVSFPDSQSAAKEITLAKKYKLHGAMLFKADGQIDPATWEMMK